MEQMDPFRGSRLKLERAWFHIEDLATQAYEYAYNARVGYGEYDARSGNRKIMFSPNPPDYLPCILGDAIHNLRTTLDHLICDLARTRCGVKNKHKFPFTSTEDDLERAIKENGFKEIGDDLVAVVKSLKPYRAGNEALRGLHDLDIKDKHQVIVPAFFKSFAGMNHAHHMADGMISAFNHFGAATGNSQSIARKLILDNRTVAPYIENGKEISVDLFFGETHHRVELYDGQDWYFGSKDDPSSYLTPMDGPFSYNFLRDSGLPFAGKPVLETLHNLAETVNEVVELFATKFGGGK